VSQSSAANRYALIQMKYVVNCKALRSIISLQHHKEITAFFLVHEIPALRTRYAQRAQTSADPEDPDFGLWTPGSEA